ncbi:hypothetical protein chiPu_0033656, partial [Chiloscyllium punctatum]|nr:hypothetical protein [Chiloscyllium punctatum]
MRRHVRPIAPQGCRRSQRPLHVMEPPLTGLPPGAGRASVASRLDRHRYAGNGAWSPTSIGRLLTLVGGAFRLSSGCACPRLFAEPRNQRRTAAKNVLRGPVELRSVSRHVRGFAAVSSDP